MKGTLKNKEGKWSIEYWDKLLPPNEIRSVLCELPLHPDSINGIEEPTDWVAYYYGREVEFEIVCKEGEIANHMLIKATGMEFPKYAKLISKQEELPESKVTRLEVIDHSGSGVGRAYSKHGINSLELSYQDDGKTLKIFIK